MWGITVLPSIPQAPHMGSYSRPVCWFNEEHFQALGGYFKYHKNARNLMECSTHFCLKSTYSKIWTMRSEDLQHIENNLPDSFTDYKGVTQSYNPAKICLKEWWYQQNSLHSLFIATKGDVWQKYIRIQLPASKDIKACESVNASQLHFDRHMMGSIHPMDGKPPPTRS